MNSAGYPPDGYNFTTFYLCSSATAPNHQNILDRITSIPPMVVTLNTWAVIT